MTSAAEKVEKLFASPVTGREVASFYTSCGSFCARGYRGSSDDIVTRAYLSAYRDGAYPDRIAMSANVFEYFLRGLASRCHQSDHAYTTQQFIEHILRDRPESLVGLRLYDATVIRNDDIPAGIINIYFGENLVAELSGWVA